MVPVPSLILQAKGVFPVLLTNPRVVTEDDIIDMAREAAGSIDTIYLHWTAGHYGQIFDDYHFPSTETVPSMPPAGRCWRKSATLGAATAAASGSRCAARTAPA